MFYIQHNNSNFTIIDCCMDKFSVNDILHEILYMMRGKNIVRFISTHPDEDHIAGLHWLV